MPVYLITYDLNKETRRPPIVKYIKEKFAYARLSESSYAVRTSLNAEQLYAAFRPFLDSDDHFYAIRLTNPHAGYGLKTVNEWLATNLRGQYPQAA